MPPKGFNPIFDVGDLAPMDILRVVRRMQGTAPLVVDHETVAGGQAVARDFLEYVRSCLRSLWPNSDEELGRLIGPVQLEFSRQDVSREQFVRELWNRRGIGMAFIESPTTYFATMCTLVENLRIEETRSGTGQTLLSLGCGPGLYESYLAAVSGRVFGRTVFRFKCVDFAPGMIAAMKRVMKFTRREYNVGLKNLEAVLDDMTVLRQFPDKSVSQIFCNNSLQWVPDWQAVIRQFARVMDPKGARLVHLFIHPHTMTAVENDGSVILRLEDVPYDKLFDELEANRFAICRTRQFAGREGSGQQGARANRLYVKAEFQPQGVKKSWHDADISGALSLL